MTLHALARRVSVPKFSPFEALGATADDCNEQVLPSVRPSHPAAYPQPAVYYFLHERSIVRLLFAAFLMTGALMGQRPSFQWPDGAKAAVALTYDDGIDVHLDHAVPDLEAAHLRGTFYVPGHSESLVKRMEEWRAIARRGHELGNHTLFHPCLSVIDGHKRTWVAPDRDLTSYTVRRIADEVKIMNGFLFAVDGLNARTLAYTCGDEVAGGKSYVDAIRPLVPAARAYKDNFRALADPLTVDIYRVPSWALKDNTGAEMIAWVEEAIGSGALAVFTFHGVGGGHNINVASPDHQKLLSWLDANRARVWTAPFLKVMDHVSSERKRLGIAPAKPIRRSMASRRTPPRRS